MTNLSLEQLESRQRRLLLQLRTLLAADDPDSADILDLATELRMNDDAINNILLR